MASFLVMMPGWLPEDYLALTVRERNAIVAALQKKHATK